MKVKKIRKRKKCLKNSRRMHTRGIEEKKERDDKKKKRRKDENV